jgi:hypothetical protein
MPSASDLHLFCVEKIAAGTKNIVQETLLPTAAAFENDSYASVPTNHF